MNQQQQTHLELLGEGVDVRVGVGGDLAQDPVHCALKVGLGLDCQAQVQVASASAGFTFGALNNALLLLDSCTSRLSE